MRANPALLSTAITLGLSVTGLGGTALAQQSSQNQGGQKMQNQAQGAQKAQNQGQQAGQGQEKIDLVAWAGDLEEQFPNAWTAERILDADVYGQNGQDIGDVENLTVGTGGQIQRIIVEMGGFWDIGDTHIAVPWNQVEVGQNFERVNVPVNEENVQNFSVFEEEENVQTGQRAWRVTELMDDYVSLQDNVGYGIVQDLLFNQGGELTAVIVYPDVGYGVGAPYAYPYFGYDRGFDPGSPYYQLPYARSEVAELGPFDYDAFMARPAPAQAEGQMQQQGQG